MVGHPVETAHSHEEVWPSDIRGYHRRTRHAPQRYALGPAFLDWESQPDPFRRFNGVTLQPLPVPQPSTAPDWGDWPGTGAPLNADSLGRFLELALGISAWKAAEGSTWAVRNNPSSGNLHPTEAYLVLPPIVEIGEAAGLYHYAPKEHGLELRCRYDMVPILPTGGFLVGLSCVAWREAWKYGERAFRYVQLDTGHVIGTLAYAAAVLGWQVRVLAQPSDAAVAGWLGLDRSDAHHPYEIERPELMLAVMPVQAQMDYALPALPPAGRWQGNANKLSEDHDPWPLVEQAFSFTHKSETLPLPFPLVTERPPPPPRTGRAAEQVIRSRRSVKKMDGTTAMSRDAFSRILRATVPDDGPLWRAFPWPPRLALFTYVHRVEGMEPGLYALIRDHDSLGRLKAAANPDFSWTPVATAEGLPLYHLVDGAGHKLASQLSCLQAIAGRGCFAISMLADFSWVLDEDGAWAYRRLHWEAGLIGQVLYLEATAAGLSGTGIGCFFDDAIKTALGITETAMAWQPVYNFTVGGGLEDSRILTLPAYPDRGGTCATDD